MTRKQTLDLLNNNQIDVILLFKRYKEHGGFIGDIDTFHVCLQRYLRFVDSLEGVYKYAMIEHIVHRLEDKEGRILMYY